MDKARGACSWQLREGLNIPAANVFGRWWTRLTEPMRVLLLSPYPELLEAPILAGGDTLMRSNAPPSEADFTADIIVSFGYRHIFSAHILTSVTRPILNVHISYLPWNRGADPNFWSWFEDTPKGVSIHCIDAGIDTGPILVQSEVTFLDLQNETLATTYGKLRARAVAMFAESWASIRANKIAVKAQRGGSYHARRDKERWWPLLPDGYDTPVAYVAEMGAKHAARVSRTRIQHDG
jgi:methionyl-tRNA formyltransferase